MKPTILNAIVLGAVLAHAQTAPSMFEVTNRDDSGPGSLRQAIIDANAHSGANTITFAHALAGTIVLTSGQVQIRSNVEIKGPGAPALTVSGDNSSRVFYIEGDPTVRISGLTVAHGFAGPNAPNPGLGGGIFVAGGTLTLTGVVVTGNRAVGVGVAPGASGSNSGGGGGIYQQAGVLVVSNSALNDNQASGGAGPCGGSAMGGGIFISGKLTLVSSALTNNVAEGGAGAPGGSGGGGLGGGIWVEGQGAVNLAAFENNVARGGAGGSGGGGGNGEGGGILVVSGGTLTVSNVVVVGNLAAGGAGSPAGQSPCGGNASGGGGGLGGGFFADSSSTLQLKESVMILNRAVGSPGIGGGIYDPGSLTLGQGTLVFANFASTSNPDVFPTSAAPSSSILP
jgi:hypothetical protein